MNAIEANQLTFHFEQQPPILDHLTATFKSGSCNLIMGPSGCGKSTFLKIIAGLLPKYGGHLTSGKVTLPGDTRPQIGMLFQDPAMQFALDTPRHEIEFALANRHLSREKITKQLNFSLDFCHLNVLADQAITTLSGGQQQRVALAVIIAMEPDIFLLDEPFANIDEANRQFLIQRLVDLQAQRPVTFIIADHDCHGYQALNPQLWDFTNHQLTALTKQQSAHWLAEADQIATTPLTCPLPATTDPTTLQLNATGIQRGDNQLLTTTTLGIIKKKVTLLTGANGSGKSSLLKAFSKLIPYQGQIFYQNHDISKISPGKYYQQVGLAFQRANDQFLNVTVDEELTLSLKHCHHPYFTPNRRQDVLEALGLTGLGNQVVYSLSGGQRKKLQLLLMLMIGHPVLLLDEPFAGLDHRSMATVCHLIEDCQQVFPQTILVVSHQLAGLGNLIDYHLVLNHHQLTYRGFHHES